ncbi:hypothetical protein TARUN_9174 [Trichoderma arundinaceum]|uniref:Uncharacterized protein n=1 Tax=Trichoderma arundinaceum TaxID=490622 RepID=A0A395NAD7_TRIAR|nr:hypothetical protein TARUN_9174 [Trichoderma arundinaceum]
MCCSSPADLTEPGQAASRRIAFTGGAGQKWTGQTRHSDALGQVADGPPYISVRRPLDLSVKSPLQGAVIPGYHVRWLYQ